MQPDLALNSNGFYDAQALRNNPSFADLFKVRFVWLGTAGTTPGAQPYTVYNADFTTQSQGQTTNVPEPTARALLLAVAVFRVARSSRALVAASRRDELPKTSVPDRTSVPIRTRSKVRFRGTPKPTRGTRVLPGTPRHPMKTLLSAFLALLLTVPATLAQLVIGPSAAAMTPRAFNSSESATDTRFD